MEVGAVEDLFGRPVVTAADMDRMTPAERREAFRSRIVWDLSQLPANYVERLRAEAERHLAEREGGETAPDARAS
jgi:hypothetical protein